MVNIEEIIWLDETVNQVVDLPLEREIAMEELVETLAPDGYFDPSEWLYEQMCLELPHHQLCDQNCPGILSTSSLAIQKILLTVAGQSRNTKEAFSRLVEWGNTPLLRYLNFI